MQYSDSRQGMMPSQSAKSLQPDQELVQRIQPILSQMVRHLLAKRPNDPVPHMVQFLSDMSGQGVPELSLDERIELENLRNAHNQLKQKLEEAGKNVQVKAAADMEESKEDNQKKKKKDDSSSSDSEVRAFQDIDKFTYLFMTTTGRGRCWRSSVCATNTEQSKSQNISLC